ncbi:unnamed protein product [Arabis nemorensis]|uniref:Uncharacterized protein n=1 Tax=Arabis nemorensis TaxID=586526 RepID=A0A565BTE0_9BRAS|nr:unnamed protein product [Arabis nemorensis]
MGADSETSSGMSLRVVMLGRGARFLSILPLSRLATGSVAIAGRSYCLAGSVATLVVVAASAGRVDSAGGVDSAGEVISAGGRVAAVGKFVPAGTKAESFVGGRKRVGGSSATGSSSSMSSPFMIHRANSSACFAFWERVRM